MFSHRMHDNADTNESSEGTTKWWLDRKFCRMEQTQIKKRSGGQICQYIL